ncbi:hypothetical protein CBL_11216 [Carabus blaptoides fortunei]
MRKSIFCHSLFRTWHTTICPMKDKTAAAVDACDSSVSSCRSETTDARCTRKSLVQSVLRLRTDAKHQTRSRYDVCAGKQLTARTNEHQPYTVDCCRLATMRNCFNVN